MSAELRKAYAIDIVGDELRVQVFDCYHTPKRVAVYREGRTTGAGYYDPQDWPQAHVGLTVREAWVKFLAGQQLHLEGARESVQYAEEMIVKACAAIADEDRGVVDGT